MAIDQYGRFIRTVPSPRINIPTRRVSQHYNSNYSAPWYLNLWRIFDNAISSIGNFIAYKADPIVDSITTICTWGYMIGLLIWVIWEWYSEGFLTAVVCAIGAVVLFYLACVVLVIVTIILRLIIGALRYLFWSGISFLMILAVVLGLVCYSYKYRTNVNDGIPNSTESSTIVYPEAVCTARVLNVRTQPNTTSKVIGTIRKGQTVVVYEIINEFARIEYNGQIAYVSLEYIQQL